MARVTVLGRSGTGKSYFVGYLLEQVVPKFALAVHYDIEDEERGLSDRSNDPLYRTVTVERDEAARANWSRILRKYRKVRVVPEGLTVEEMRLLYAEICRVTMQLCRQKREISAFVSCDEAHNLLTQSAFPQPVERMITGGRKHSCETLHTSQRPQLLHTTVISQADKRVYFALSDDNDIRKVERTASFPAQKLKNLPARTCIVENKDTGEWTELDTNGIGRKRPHYSGDDGIVDSALPV